MSTKREHIAELAPYGCAVDVQVDEVAFLLIDLHDALHRRAGGRTT